MRCMHSREPRSFCALKLGGIKCPQQLLFLSLRPMMQSSASFSLQDQELQLCDRFLWFLLHYISEFIYIYIDTFYTWQNRCFTLFRFIVVTKFITSQNHHVRISQAATAGPSSRSCGRQASPYDCHDSWDDFHREIMINLNQSESIYFFCVAPSPLPVSPLPGFPPQSVKHQSVFENLKQLAVLLRCVAPVFDELVYSCTAWQSLHDTIQLAGALIFFDFGIVCWRHKAQEGTTVFQGKDPLV